VSCFLPSNLIRSRSAETATSSSEQWACGPFYTLTSFEAYLAPWYRHCDIVYTRAVLYIRIRSTKELELISSMIVAWYSTARQWNRNMTLASSQLEPQARLSSIRGSGRLSKTHNNNKIGVAVRASLLMVIQKIEIRASVRVRLPTSFQFFILGIFCGFFLKVPNPQIFLISQMVFVGWSWTPTNCLAKKFR
jgi:hypothetical protein